MGKRGKIIRAVRKEPKAFCFQVWPGVLCSRGANIRPDGKVAMDLFSRSHIDLVRKTLLELGINVAGSSRR